MKRRFDLERFTAVFLRNVHVVIVAVLVAILIEFVFSMTAALVGAVIVFLLWALGNAYVEARKK